MELDFIGLWAIKLKASILPLFVLENNYPNNKPLQQLQLPFQYVQNLQHNESSNFGLEINGKLNPKYYWPNLQKLEFENLELLCCKL